MGGITGTDTSHSGKHMQSQGQLLDVRPWLASPLPGNTHTHTQRDSSHAYYVDARDIMHSRSLILSPSVFFSLAQVNTLRAKHGPHPYDDGRRQRLTGASGLP